MSTRTLEIETAPVFEPLLDPARYKGAWGGRGSGKSYFFADLLIEWCLLHPGTRWLCVREIQKTLRQSAKRLIESELERLELGEADGFKPQNERIITPGGGTIEFVGMQDHTADSIKSFEGFDGCWVEEAQTLSERSLSLLRPTIRKEGSELWFSWNPRRKVDPVDAMLRGETLPTGAVVVKANWSDNPWFPGVLEQERLDCLKADPDGYDHIWEGGYVTVAKGAYYAEHLAKCKRDGRIGNVGPDPLMEYRAFVDIGGSGAKADAFAMWVCQWVGREVRVLDWYEAVGQDPKHHFEWLRDRGYEKARIYLPHDGDAKRGVDDTTWAGTFRKAGYKVETVPNQGKGAAGIRIKEARKLFPSIWFNEATTEGGRAALGWYHEKMHPELGVGLGPEHDWASHSSDAFGLMCCCYEPPQGTPATKPPRYSEGEDYSTGTGY